jgi:hypothetical protein
MPRRQGNVSVFAVVALMAVPFAVVLEIGTVDLGREITWRLFGGAVPGTQRLVALHDNCGGARIYYLCGYLSPESQ